MTSTIIVLLIILIASIGFLIYLFLYICALKRFTTDGKQEIYLHEGYGKKARRVHTYNIQGVEK